MYVCMFLSSKKSQTYFTKSVCHFAHMETIIPGYGFTYCSSMVYNMSHFAAYKAGE